MKTTNIEETPIREEEGDGTIRRKNKIITGAVILAVIAVIAAIYFYLQYSSIKANPQQISQQEVTNLVEEVGKLILLPTDEVPTVATVTDPEPLKSQAFFANAQRGDRVLIYTGAKKAILYSPTEKKIVEVAPVNIGNQGQTPATTPTKK